MRARWTTALAVLVMLGAAGCAADTMGPVPNESKPPEPKPGTISIRVSTSGVDFGPDDYVVHVEGQADRPIGANDSITIAGVRAGKYAVRLDGLAANCQVNGEGSRSVTVPADYLVQVEFTVTCRAVVGSLRVRVATSGVDIDPRDYTLTVDDGPGWAIAINGTRLVDSLRAGTHTATLAIAAINCTVVGPNPATIEVTAAATSELWFPVECVPSSSDLIAFVLERHIHVIAANGTGLKQLTSSAASDADPAWSPDGDKIAFQSDRDGHWEIYVMNADGSDQRRLTNTTAPSYSPTWSPDGRRIAFVREVDGNADIHVMDADGSNVARIFADATIDLHPAWSPDGSTIAFDRSVDPTVDGSVYLIDADGSNPRSVISSAFQLGHPAWSPDGTRLAFEEVWLDEFGALADILVMNADGTEWSVLPSYGGYSAEPAWSPDGKLIAFVGDQYGGQVIRVAGVDGSGPVYLTVGRSPAWRPARRLPESSSHRRAP